MDALVFPSPGTELSLLLLVAIQAERHSFHAGECPCASLALIVGHLLVLLLVTPAGGAPFIQRWSLRCREQRADAAHDGALAGGP